MKDPGTARTVPPSVRQWHRTPDRKASAGEREVVALVRAAGVPAERTWHTAQAADATLRCCDVTIAWRPAQVRLRRKGFAALYGALEGVEVAFLRLDGRESLAPAKNEPSENPDILIGHWIPVKQRLTR